MQIIGAGFGRTGTMSLKVALEELGVGPCFHCLDPSVAAGAATGTSRWGQLASEGGSELDWQEILAGWGATVGWVGARFYREMLQTWPDVRVLLSVRDPDAWYASCHNSIRLAREVARANSAGSPARREVASTAGWRGRSAPGLDAGRGQPLQEIDRLIRDSIFEGRLSERDHAISVYHQHNAQVASTVRRERLLVYGVDEGWGPLCEFLGVDVPSVPFPHLNTGESLRRRIGTSRPPIPATKRYGRARYSHMPGRRRQGTETHVGPRITGIAVADSDVTLTQEQVLGRLGLEGDEFAEGIFARCGVSRRHLNLAEDFLALTLQGRTTAVEEELMRQSVRAVDILGVDPSRIGTVVSASLYSLGCPTLAHRLVDHYAMGPTTDKYHVTGVGCASAVPLMRLAAKSLHDQPGRQGLVVAAESMSGILMGATVEDPRAKTVGSAIFGDGCAAALLSGDRDATGPAILASRVHQIGGTLGAVSLSCSPLDSHLHLDRELPDIAGAGLRSVVDRFLADQRLTCESIDHWIVHPGGRRIIETVQEALELSRDQVQTSWDALAEHGNVGTPSILYVLKDALERDRPQPGEHGLAVTIGPGVTVGLMLLGF